MTGLIAAASAVAVAALGSASVVVASALRQNDGSEWHDHRDVFVRAAAWAGAAVLATVEPGLAILLAGALWRWTGGTSPLVAARQTAEVVLFAAIAVVYLVVRLVPLAADPYVVAGLAVLAAAHVGAAVVEGVAVVRFKIAAQEARELIIGFAGNRIYVGLLSAAALPLVDGWWTLPFLLGLALSTSLTAVSAAAVGASVRWPWLAPWMALFVGLQIARTLAKPWIPARIVRALRWAWRGSAWDSYQERLLIWTLMWQVWRGKPWAVRWWGVGRNALETYYGRWWQQKGYTGPLVRQAHNDLFQVTFEYGLCGALGALLWVGHVVSRMSVGDPLSAALAVLLAASLVQMPFMGPHVGAFALVVAALLSR